MVEAESKYTKAGEVRADTALFLDVPDSGVPWLDDMIREGLRDQFAQSALESGTCPHDGDQFEAVAEWAYAMADAMLAAREAKP